MMQTIPHSKLKSAWQPFPPCQSKNARILSRVHVLRSSYWLTSLLVPGRVSKLISFGRPAQAESCYVEPGSGALVTAQGSAGEWSEHVDDEGRTYYYSSVTGESQYEPPH